MRPFETLDRVTTSEGRELSLHHHDGHYFIHLDGEELMSTWVHGKKGPRHTILLGRDSV